jgi:hypothetical protein
MDSLPIGDYALLSDCRTAALVSREGSVDWLCFPRFDAPSVFCRLLDPAGGHFAIRPAGEFQASRRYVDQTMVLETTFTSAGGTAVLTDALTVGRNERGHDLGENSPSMLARRLACTDGEIEAEVVYAPRPQYGDICPRLVPVAGGIAASGGAEPLLLVTSAAFDVDGAIATARVRLAAGQAAVFVVAHGMATPPQPTWSVDHVAARLADTVGHTPELRRPLAGACPALRASAACADVRTYGRYRGGADDVVAGDRWRSAELGLPLHVGAGRQSDAARTMGGGLPGRSAGVLRIPR